MRPDMVVILAPFSQHCPGLCKRREQGFVQQFVAQSSVEAFDEGILGRFAGSDVVPFHASVLGPARDRHASQFGATFADGEHYNPKRRHSTIGYLSPMGVERQAGFA